MEEKNMTATLKYAIISEKKMSLIAKMVKGKDVNEAMTILKLYPKKGADILYKVIKSAYSNSKNNGNLSDGLLIKRIDVGRGPKIGRIRFTSRARVSRYCRSRSFVRVVLGNK